MWVSIANQDGYASIAPRMPNGGFLMAIGNDGTLAVLNPISGALAELPTALGQPALGSAIGSREGVFVTLQDGTHVDGRLLNHDTFSVQLLDSNEQLRSFARADLRGEGFIPSPMPSVRGLFDDQELADIVQYMISLRGTEKK